jgi:glutathione synthase/RimK-type ligase-like ATP-grasp enzyme
VEDILMSWADLTPALVVNRPFAMAGNNSKPYQAAWIHSLGFQVPDTLITTEPSAVLEFQEKHGTLIYKSMSGVRSIVSRLTAAHRERLRDIVWCPTQFQQYVPGVDYRVHIVGSVVFPCRIRSDGDDYRYASRADAPVTIEVADLPDKIADGCRALAHTMKLLFAGVDLRQTPDDEWFCFEVNPSPGFTYYEQATEQPLAESVARILAQADEERR